MVPEALLIQNGPTYLFYLMYGTDENQHSLYAIGAIVSIQRNVRLLGPNGQLLGITNKYVLDNSVEFDSSELVYAYVLPDIDLGLPL